MNYKTLLTSFLLFLILRTGIAQGPSETRSYMKAFGAGKDISLEVTNKYGTVEITSWNKDSVYIRAEIKAFAPSQDKLSPLFDGITINISETGPLLIAQTVFAQSFSRLFEGFKGMTSKIISYDSRVEINYYIKVPEYLNLKIDNRYGDVYMENCTGKLTASISNGSFKAGNIGKESDLKLSFCDATINSLSSGRIDASFSEVNAENIGIVTISSISSKFNIINAAEIRFESRRDKYSIENIETATGETYFTDFILKNLKKEISLITKYGSLTAESIEKDFESINLNSGYTDIRLGFAENSSYSLDIRHMNTFLSLPAKNIKTDVKILNEEKKEYITYGTVGNSLATAKVKIDASRGKIYIK